MCLWTDEEKRNLLKGLQRYGLKDLKLLKKCVPNKTIQEIKLLCEEYSKKASLNLTKPSKAKQSNIIRWLNIMKRIENDSRKSIKIILPRVLKYITLFENHSNDSSKTCYKFLYELSIGKEPYDLDEEDNKLLYDCLVKLANRLKYNEVKKYKKFIQDFDYKDDRDKCMIGKSYNLNPLQVPDDLLN